MIHPTSKLVEDVLLIDLDLASYLKPFPVQPPGRRQRITDTKWHPLDPIVPQLARIISLSRIGSYTSLRMNRGDENY